MEKKNGVGFNGLLLNWLISYGIILLLSFSFILISSYVLSRNLRDESFRSHRETVRQSQMSMDYILKEIDVIAGAVSILNEVQSLGGYDGMLGPRQYYLKNLLFEELKKMKNSHPLIETIYVFFPEGDYVVSAKGAWDTDFFYRYYEDSGYTKEEWISRLLTKGHMNTYSLLQKQRQPDDKRQGVPTIQFITTDLYYGPNSSPRVSICLTVQESSLISLIGGKEKTGDFFIMDGPERTFLMDSPELPENFPTYGDFLAQEDANRLLDDNLLTAYPSQITDWLFISYSSQSVVEGRITRVRWILFLLVLTFWLVGAVAAFLLARRNYQPVTRLMDYVSGNLDDGEITHFRREEYRYIEESFHRLQEEKASIQDQLTLQKETLRNNFLSRLLTGRLKETTYNLEEQCQYQGFFFEEEAFLTVILKMESTVLKEDQLTQERGALWLSNQIQSVLADFTSGSGWVIDISNLTVLFMNVHCPSDDPQLLLPEFLGNFQDRILRETGITYTIGTSSFKTELSAVPLAYEEAQEALDFRMVKGKGAVISYYDIMENDRDKKTYNSLNWERRFINLFTSGSYEEAGVLIQNALAQLENMGNLDMAKIRLFGVMNIFLDVLEDLFDDSFMGELDCENRMLRCTTINETKREMDSLFSEIISYSTGQKKGSLKTRVNEILEKSFADPNLSVGSLAEQLGLSISNFSWLFKEETGMGPLDCIHRIRIREARRLLVETENTVKEIAIECGYLSDIAFIRVFKKYQGLTPGQYRQSVPEKAFC